MLRLLVGSAIGTVSISSGGATNQQIEIGRLAQFADPKLIWTPADFYQFLRLLPAEAMLRLKVALKLLTASDDESSLKGPVRDAREVQKHAMWMSHNALNYLHRNPDTIDYHLMVMDLCREMRVPLSEGEPTFVLERRLQDVLFVQLWDGLTPAQREAFVSRLEVLHGKDFVTRSGMPNRRAVSLLSGAAALTLLSATVAWQGFAFYTTMSVFIGTVAAAAGVTVPFAVYMGASTLAAILAGPIGLAAIAAFTVGGIGALGAANVRETASLISMVHALKIESLRAAGQPVV